MSQFFIDSAHGPVPPSVATSYVTDSGTAVPAASVLNVLGDGSTTTSASGNTITITSNQPTITGTATTIGAVTGDVITVPLGAIPGVYTFDCKIAGFNSTTPAGAGYALTGSVRTTGAAAVLLTNQSVDAFEEAATTPGSCALVVSGNSAIFRVTGTAGLTIQWKGITEYIFVS